MFGDFGKMLKVAGEMKRRLPELKEKMAASAFSRSESGVTAVVNGRGELADLTIDPALLAGGDAQGLARTIVSAVTAAQADAAAAMQAAMKELTGGIDLPGMDGLMP